MTTKQFIALNIPKFCAIEWHIPSTYFTRSIVLKTEWFDSYTERDFWLKRHKKSWWEHLPFITQYYYVSMKGCNR